MKEKTRVILGIALFFILIITIGFAIKNKDELFKSKVDITYADGCVEKYENAVLITPVCENGRHLEETRKNMLKDKTPTQPIFNIES